MPSKYLARVLHTGEYFRSHYCLNYYYTSASNGEKLALHLKQDRARDRQKTGKSHVAYDIDRGQVRKSRQTRSQAFEYVIKIVSKKTGGKHKAGCGLVAAPNKPSTRHTLPSPPHMPHSSRATALWHLPSQPLWLPLPLQMRHESSACGRCTGRINYVIGKLLNGHIGRARNLIYTIVFDDCTCIH